MKFVCSLAFSRSTDYCRIARACEDAGIDAVSLSDHVVHPRQIQSPYPYTPDGKPRWEPFTEWPDPFVAIGAMSSVTTRLNFLTSVYVLPMRNPFLAAKSVATASVMSDGRVALGIGVGWMKDEFVLMGQNFHTRGKRTNEMIEIMRKLWAGGWVEYHGELHDFDALEMSPAPPSEIPIYVGGISEPALRRAAQLGDGWISDLHDTAELAAIIEKLQTYRRDSERADRPFCVLASCSDAFDLGGYRRLEEIGVTHVITMPWVFYGAAPGQIDGQIDGIKRFAEDIISRQ